MARYRHLSDVDDQIARARAAMERIAEGHGAGAARGPAARGRQRQVQDLGRRVTRAAVADGAILLAAIVIGMIVPIGIFGLLLTVLLMVVATAVLFAAPTQRPVSAERLVQADLKALPAQTERWLVAQRPALPAPAVTLVDRIGQRLETLSPQLARIPDDAPEAAEVRKLIGEQLPAFVGDYTRVPAELRGTARNGRSPDTELVDGLKLIEQEIGEMTARLAADDLNQLSTRGRFLEMKYKDDGE